MDSYGVTTLPNSKNFLNAECLCPLLEYSQSIPAINTELAVSLTINQLNCEIQVFKELSNTKEGLQSKVIDVRSFLLQDVLEHYTKLL